jgi:cation transport ATPase
VAAVTRGARAGILIRGGAFLKALADVPTVAFDKAGTLTVGRPPLTDVLALNGAGEAEALCLAAALEKASEDPWAGAGALRRATVRHRLADASDAQAEPGVGVRATVGSERLFVGRPDGLAAHGDGALSALRLEGRQ